MAAAQLPLLFLLSMRTRFSPLVIIFGSSHEQLIHWHRICGRVIMILLLLHGTWYINYFVQNGILADRIRQQHPITGLISISLIATIASTSLERVRNGVTACLFTAISVLGWRFGHCFFSMRSHSDCTLLKHWHCSSLIEFSDTWTRSQTLPSLSRCLIRSC